MRDERSTPERWLHRKDQEERKVQRYKRAQFVADISLYIHRTGNTNRPSTSKCIGADLHLYDCWQCLKSFQLKLDCHVNLIRKQLYCLCVGVTLAYGMRRKLRSRLSTQSREQATKRKGPPMSKTYATNVGTPETFQYITTKGHIHMPGSLLLFSSEPRSCIQ